MKVFIQERSEGYTLQFLSEQQRCGPLRKTNKKKKRMQFYQKIKTKKVIESFNYDMFIKFHRLCNLLFQPKLGLRRTFQPSIYSFIF